MQACQEDGCDSVTVVCEAYSISLELCSRKPREEPTGQLRTREDELPRNCRMGQMPERGLQNRVASMQTCCGDRVLKSSSSRARTKCAVRARRGPGQVVMARWSSLLLLHTTLHWGQPQRRSESKAPMSPVEQPALLWCAGHGQGRQRSLPVTA